MTGSLCVVLMGLAMVALFFYAPQEAGSQQARDGIEVTRAAIKAERRAIVSLNLELTNAESQAFWPVYDEYWVQMKKIGDREVLLIEDFAKNYKYESLSDEKAEEMIKEMLSIMKDENQLKRKYVKKFQKALPAKKVLRYYQIENKLDAMINIDLAATIPLAK
jgi:predicted restriction endonuclease